MTLWIIPERERSINHIVNRFNNLQNHLQLFDDPLYSDVAFAFSGPHGKMVKIYTASKLLRTASEYFSDMFAFGGFGMGPSSIRDDDSDKELDKAIFHQPLEPRDNPHSVTVVAIKHSCYSTYRALLYYLLSGEISFAPLRSSKLPDKETEAEQEADLSSNTSPWASRPIRVSPKSIYRLADEHRIIPLRELALQSITAGLTVQGVLAEVSSSFAREYDEVRHAGIQFLAQHWADVKETTSYEVFKSREDLSGSLLGEIVEEVRRQSGL
ncbi:hypothetical protein BT69DRAFT_1101455 [Atractiella rhizophila]|nr:hypothetical protein BT69DRAFT_1101455 [Atractiella rhizophila]